jgi:hypothetical protein
MVRYPAMRNQLVRTIRALADVAYQGKVWVNLQLPVVPWEDNLDEAVHFILDDMSLDTYLEQAIGPLLENAEEAEAVAGVVRALKVALDRLPADASDEEFINSQYWPAVVSASRHAYRVLTGGQDPDGMFEDLGKGWFGSVNRLL